MLNATIDIPNPRRSRSRWGPAVLALSFLGVFAFTVMAPLAIVVPATGVDSAFAKGNGKGKGRATAPGQVGQQDEDVVDMGETAPGPDERAIAESGGGAADTADDALPSDTPPANITVIKELAGLPENSALSEEEEMEAIRNGWGTWRTADGPDTIMAR